MTTRIATSSILSDAGRTWITLILLALLLPSCQVFGVEKELQRFQQLPVISGTVESERAGEGHIIVVLALIARDSGVCTDDIAIVDHVVLDEPGGWVFGMKAGTYLVGAFQDLNSDLHYESDEPLSRLCGSTPIEIEIGQRIDDIEISIPRETEGMPQGVRLSILDLEDDSARDQGLVTFRQLLVYGDVQPLWNEYFNPEWAEKGLWKPAEFLLAVRPGVYFLEEFDPDKIPVLFVHGISGYPGEFSYLIDQLDRDRFQPWVYFYPSGLNLTGLGNALNTITTELRVRHGFDQLVVVAHSMGGLVSRRFILTQAETSPSRYIPLFVSISSPFGGMSSAQSGTESSPITLPDSIHDVATKSEFLAELWYLDPETKLQPRPWPKGVVHHMIFGFQRASGLPGESSDKTVAVWSQLRPEAQQFASSIFGVDADHTGILRRPETATRLNALLAKLPD